MPTLPDFSGLRVHVIGDAIRDVYTQARCLGAASKSPTLVYETLGSREWVGGAGVVAAHCRAAGAEVTLTTANNVANAKYNVIALMNLTRLNNPMRLNICLWIICVPRILNYAFTSVWTPSSNF